MKKLRILCLTALLTLTCALSVSAGQIECGRTSSPPPEQPRAATVTDAGIADAVLVVLKSVWMIF